MKSKIQIQAVYLILMSVGILFFIGSCNSGTLKDEEQQILEQQVMALEEEQQALEEIFTKIMVAQDSLERQQQKLQMEKQEIEASMRDLNSAESRFTEMRKEEMEKELKQKRENYQVRLEYVDDSLNLIRDQILSLQHQIDTLDIAEKQLVTQREVSQDRLVTGIDAIDERLDKLEKENLVKQREIEINIHKIELAESKIDLLEDEKNIYQREKNELLKQNSDDDEIASFENKINEISGSIEDEVDKINAAKAGLRSLNEWVRDFVALKENLRANMEKEYSEQQTIADFTKSEMDRLGGIKSNIDSELEQLQHLQVKLEKRKVLINGQIDTLDREIGLVKDKKLADLLDKKALLEKEEADLARQESSVLDDDEDLISEMAEFDIDDTAADLGMLRQLDYEIKNKRMEIERLKSSISASNESLAEKKALIEEKRSKNARVISTSAGITVIVVVGILFLLYFLGRRNLNKKAS